MADAITISGVHKRFGATHAVRDLNLVVPQGSLCGFLGPNGAGKSTTIRMIMSIIYPDAGAVNVLGGSALESKDRIGYLPEERGVYRKMRVGEFVEYIAKLKGAPTKGLSGRVRDWLHRIGLPNVERRKCQELSKGMQQKVQFLAAIIHEPELLILDEPFSGLDPVNAVLMRDLIQEQHAAGRTIIYSTHALHQAEQICDRIFLINHGAKILDATVQEIRSRFDPRTIRLEPFGSTKPVEAFAATIPGVTSVRMHDDGLELLLSDDADPPSIMRTLVNQHTFRAIEIRQVSLEEVFIRLVRSEEGEDAARRAQEELATA
jgi:ABC-2 type transport system ATP-binding protein